MAISCFQSTPHVQKEDSYTQRRKKRGLFSDYFIQYPLFYPLSYDIFHEHKKY